VDKNTDIRVSSAFDLLTISKPRSFMQIEFNAPGALHSILQNFVRHLLFVVEEKVQTSEDEVRASRLWSNSTKSDGILHFSRTEKQLGSVCIIPDTTVIACWHNRKE